MKPQTICCILFIAASLTPARMQSKTVYSKQLNNNEIELELDAYYSCIAWYKPLTGAPVPYMGEQSELSIYKNLITSPRLRFLVLETSLYPMPCLGLLIKKQFPGIYGDLNLRENFNLVQSICAGFEEPYAISLFLGDVVSFRPENNTKLQGKGYSGMLLSVGNYHIKDNELIHDNWVESEIKVKGDRIAGRNKMSWSFRIGSKFHNNRHIKDIFYFSVKRDRQDMGTRSSYLFHNSSFEYTIDISARHGNIISHLLVAGKKFPLKKTGPIFSINTGILWEGADKYSGPLERTHKTGKTQLLFRPNLEF